MHFTNLIQQLQNLRTFTSKCKNSAGKSKAMFFSEVKVHCRKAACIIQYDCKETYLHEAEKDRKTALQVRTHAT